MPRKSRKQPKGKVIDALPKNLRPALDTARLRDLTFADLNTVARQFDKFFDQDPSAFVASACGACGKWGG
jgi:hypothetical protein